MRTRILLVALLLPALAAPLLAEDETTPPSMDVSGSRESSTWIELPSGTQVAVGKGVEWQGVRVHLALTWHLVAVDVASGAVLWDRNVSAYWNEVGFEEVEREGGAKAWAVELRPGRRATRGRERRAWYDLRTGTEIPQPDAEAPSGKRFAPTRAWDGDQSLVDRRFAVLVTTKEEWKAVREHVWGADTTNASGEVDFEKEVVLLLSSGNAFNCDGITCVGCWEDERRILVRTGRKTYQTVNGGRKTRPWGAIVLPRREEKAYVVERNAQNLIGGPPLWEETWRADHLPKEPTASKRIPARATAPHAGWDGD